MVITIKWQCWVKPLAETHHLCPVSCLPESSPALRQSIFPAAGGTFLEVFSVFRQVLLSSCLLLVACFIMGQNLPSCASLSSVVKSERESYSAFSSQVSIPVSSSSALSLAYRCLGKCFVKSLLCFRHMLRLYFPEMLLSLALCSPNASCRLLDLVMRAPDFLCNLQGFIVSLKRQEWTLTTNDSICLINARRLIL